MRLPPARTMLLASLLSLAVVVPLAIPRDSGRLPAQGPAGVRVSSTPEKAPFHTSSTNQASLSSSTEPAAATPEPTPVPLPQASQTGSPPLRLVFPTPQAAPVSAWRPPLYPTPWALTPYDHFYFSRPIAADEVNWPLADYRYGGIFFEHVVHTGIDIPVEPGTPALAAGSGKVIWAGYGLYSLIPGDQDDPYGLAVAIRHEFGYQGENLYTVYGHLSRVDVVKGQRVETGDALGLTGDTGKTTGPHLHFEVRIGKNNFFGSRNPELWLAPPQGWGLLAARVMNTAGQLLPGLEFKVQSKETGQVWTVKSYGKGSANSDFYYQENLVLGDLPAGTYTILIPYAGSIYNWDVQVSPGMVSYFTFRGKMGFKTDPPPLPETGFTPPDQNLSNP